MTRRPVRRFVDGLLRSQRTQRARPDDTEAAEMRTAIELRAARTGSDSPREEFVTDLHRRLAEQMEAPQAGRPPSGTRRNVVIGTGLAAASAATGIVIGRNLLAPSRAPSQASPPGQGVLDPNSGRWHSVGASADLSEDGALAFDLGAVNGFVHRRGARIEAVSGVCTHQGCRLWLDAPQAQLRCPCHSTSFALTGETLTHQLPSAPPPLPKLEVRETNGRIEVFAPTEPA